MRKFWLSLITVVTLSISAFGFATLNVDAEPKNDIKLTEDQKREMESLQQNALNQKIGIINKYVEYGVFSEEKGEKIISHLEERYKKLEENGFIPQWDKKHKKYKREDSHHLSQH